MNTTTAEMTAVMATPDLTRKQRHARAMKMQDFEQKAFLAALPAFIALGKTLAASVSI